MTVDVGYSPVPKTIADSEAEDINGQTKRLSGYPRQDRARRQRRERLRFHAAVPGPEVLYRKHKDRGFIVLGFPCNQFGGQEPGLTHESRFLPGKLRRDLPPRSRRLT